MWKILGLCLVPVFLGVVFTAPSPDKRLIDALGFNLTDVFDLDVLYCDVQILLDVLGSEPTESACEDECHILIQDGTTFEYGCPLVCRGLQYLANYFHEEPEPGQENAPCGGANPVGKR